MRIWIGCTIAYSKCSKITHAASISDQIGAVPDASFSQHCVACHAIGVSQRKKKLYMVIREDQQHQSFGCYNMWAWGFGMSEGDASDAGGMYIFYSLACFTDELVGLWLWYWCI